MSQNNQSDSHKCISQSTTLLFPFPILPLSAIPPPISSMAADPPFPPSPHPPEKSLLLSAAAPSDSLVSTLRNSIDALGRGFDVSSDIRLLYCKGSPASRLVHIEEERRSDIVVSDELVLEDVSVDVVLSRGMLRREATPVWSFIEMSEHFNKISGIPGSIPNGSFNAMFNFTGNEQNEEVATKSLAMVGYFISLYKLQLSRSELTLCDEVKRAVPNAWIPASLASFIENYGTHVVTSTTIGGRDMIYLRQHQSSSLSAFDFEKYVKDVEDQRFMDLRNQPSAAPVKHQDKDITVIFRRRGGDDLERSPSKWVETVEKSPDVINMTFIPIVSLLEGVPGLQHLSHAIELYLKYKPPIADLQYFFEFQIARAWAPEQSNIQRKEPVCPYLQFSLMGPKLYVSLDQVAVGRKPVTGLRLCLEGSKQNRLTIHLQRLVSLPKILQPHWDSHIAIGAQIWRGPEEQDSRWFEPIKWKHFSYVSTAPIEHKETSIGDLSGAHIVTGAQLGVWDFGSRSVLYLKLLFAKVPGCTIRQSVWDHSPSKLPPPQRPEGTSTSNNERITDDKKLDSTSIAVKLAKLVDCTEMLKGPQDSPGHWLVTGAKLGIDKGRIVLRVKYSLLNY